MRFWGLFLMIAVLPLGAFADTSIVSAPGIQPDTVSLGWGRLFTNDLIGDGHDRWHTGSYAFSQVRGPYWRGTLPSQPGQLLELRFEADIVTPESLSSPAPTDRRYAGILGLGLHTQFDWRGLEANVGGDLFATGPQTRLGDFQDWVHDQLSLGNMNPALGAQLGDAVYPTFSAELGKSYPLGIVGSVRPYVAAMAGFETWARAGGDVTLGHFGDGAVMLRDVTTGQRYRAVAGNRVTGFSFTFGGDVAHVFSSVLMPSGGNVVASATRERLRAGLHWQGINDAVFYGLTWLGPEYVGQPGGQVVGSLHIQLQF